jgi:hypothetical protein
LGLERRGGGWPSRTDGVLGVLAGPRKRVPSSPRACGLSVQGVGTSGMLTATSPSLGTQFSVFSSFSMDGAV